jgi:hypothetical protein
MLLSLLLPLRSAAQPATASMHNATVAFWVIFIFIFPPRSINQNGLPSESEAGAALLFHCYGRPIDVHQLKVATDTQ